MIPKGLSDEHFQHAALEIDRRGVARRRASRHYDLILNSKSYPPKYVISLANRFAHGNDFPADKFNAIEAKEYFLRSGYKVRDRRRQAQNFIAPQDDESAFPEGGECFKRHRYLERDSAITRKAKKKRLAEVAMLECDVCGFNFESRYGDLGRGFIEAHHLTPVAKLEGKTKTKITELGLVCSNCHRMLHRGLAPLSIAALRRVIRG